MVRKENELAELFPGSRTLSLRVVRITGKGESRKVGVEKKNATVYPLSIQQLGRVGLALAPIAAMDPKADVDAPVYTAVADVIGWPVDDVSSLVAADFRDLMANLLELNADFFIQPRGNLASGTPGPKATNGDGSMQSSSLNAPDAPTPNA